MNHTLPEGCWLHAPIASSCLGITYENEPEWTSPRLSTYYRQGERVLGKRTHSWLWLGSQSNSWHSSQLIVRAEALTWDEGRRVELFVLVVTSWAYLSIMDEMRERGLCLRPSSFVPAQQQKTPGSPKGDRIREAERNEPWWKKKLMSRPSRFHALMHASHFTKQLNDQKGLCCLTKQSVSEGYWSEVRACSQEPMNSQNLLMEEQGGPRWAVWF